jgi:hypothetical protein
MQLTFIGIAFIFAIEFFDTAGAVDQFLFTGKERMTGGANFHFNITDSRTGHEGIATGTRDSAFFVFRMNIGFHF